MIALEHEEFEVETEARIGDQPVTAVIDLRTIVSGRMTPPSPAASCRIPGPPSIA